MKPTAIFKSKAGSLVAYLLFLFLSQLLLISFLLYQKTKNEKEHFATLIDARKAEYNHVVSSQARLVNTIFQEVLNKPEITRIIKEASLLEDPASQQNSRDQLFAMLSSTYERLEKNRVRQIQFHFPDGTSFLRLHNPGEFGDNLFDVRPSVRLANSKKIYTSGFEEGRDSHAFRHVFPLFLDGEHVGSVEIGIPFYVMRMELMELFPSESLFIIKKKIVESLVFKKNLKNYIPSEINEDFFMEKADSPSDPVSSDGHPADSGLIRVINRGIKNDLSNHLSSDKPFVIVTTVAHVPYTITAIPVVNTEEKVAGFILYYQTDATLSRLQQSYYLIYGAVTLLSVFLMGLYRWSSKEIISQNIFLQNIIESLPHPFYVIDTKDYSLTLANSLVAPDNKWQGLTCHELTHKNDKPCDAQAHLCPLKEVMKTRKAVILEHVHQNFAGEERLVEVHGCPIFDEKGAIAQMIEYSIDITARKLAERERERLIGELQNALKDVKQLSGFIPICASCKDIRNDEGYWQKVEQYIKEHSEAKFSHGICPDCAKKLYPEFELYRKS